MAVHVCSRLPCSAFVVSYNAMIVGTFVAALKYCWGPGTSCLSIQVQTLLQLFRTRLVLDQCNMS